MFELIDIIGVVLCIFACVACFLIVTFISKKIKSDVYSLEDKKHHLSLEYKYQIEKLLEELKKLIDSKKNI